MKTYKTNARGFAHQVAILGVSAVVVIGGVFVGVLKAHDSSNAKANQTTGKHATSKSKLSSSQQSQSKLSSAGSTPGAASTTPSSKTTTSKSSTSGSTSAGQSAPSSTPAATPAQTPLSVLTALITDLDNGAQVDITASAVTVPGPISDAQARPIVFTANGQVYFAYHQGSAANFTTSASQTAGSMAIVKATVNGPALERAHLDKAANLVDPNISAHLVGYSQGGS